MQCSKSLTNKLLSLFDAFLMFLEGTGSFLLNRQKYHILKNCNLCTYENRKVRIFVNFGAK
jgi:hypothetical protein